MSFDEPELTSDAGLAAIAASGTARPLIQTLAGCIDDPRKNPDHTTEQLLSQRIFQILGGAYHADDCDHLRHDLIFRAAAGKRPEDGPLASQPTMSRLENRIRPREVLRMAQSIFEDYLESLGPKPPPMVCIDMDPSAHLIYGQQQLGLFNTHVGDHCLMPFYVFDGCTGQIMTAALRPGKTPTDSEILAILKRLVKGLRERWPRIRITFRADSHHTKPAVMDYLESEGIDFATGLATNVALEKCFFVEINQARRLYQRLVDAHGSALGVEVTEYASAFYAAKSWSKQRRVIARIKVNTMGVDVRYIVTSFHVASPKYLYANVYCGRGEAELYIKECKDGLGSDTSSCQSATANQFRLLLHVVAYVILHRFRTQVLAGTKWAAATFAQIRLRLLKVAGRLEVKKTRVLLHLAEALEPMLGPVWRTVASGSG